MKRLMEVTCHPLPLPDLSTWNGDLWSHLLSTPGMACDSPVPSRSPGPCRVLKPGVLAGWLFSIVTRASAGLPSPRDMAALLGKGLQGCVCFNFEVFKNGTLWKQMPSCYQV